MKRVQKSEFEVYLFMEGGLDFGEEKQAANTQPTGGLGAQCRGNSSDSV